MMKVIAGHTFGNMDHDRSLIKVTPEVATTISHSAAGLFHAAPGERISSIVSAGLIPGTGVDEEGNVSEGKGRPFVFFGPFPPDDKRYDVAGRAHATDVVVVNKNALVHVGPWYVSHQGAILAACAIPPSYIDSVYRRIGS